jgi:hypothetical protein
LAPLRTGPGSHASDRPRNQPNVGLGSFASSRLGADHFWFSPENGPSGQAISVPSSPHDQAILKALHSLAAAFNAHDLDRIMDHFAEDCVLEMPRGREV